MAKQDDRVVQLLERLVNQSEATNKALEGLQTSATIARQGGGQGGGQPTGAVDALMGVTSASGFTRGGALANAARMSALGKGGSMGGIAGGVLGAVQSLTDAFVNDRLKVSRDTHQAVVSGISGASPWRSGEAVSAELNASVRQTARVSRSNQWFKGEHWRTGFYNWNSNFDEAMAHAKNLRDKQRIEPGLRAIRGAKSAASSQLGGLSQFGKIDDSTIQQVYEFNKKFQQNRVAFEKQLENIAGKEEAILFNSIGN